ncbi:hypothetical protein QLX08_007997 [Tetragonisca angustula]|uniref:Chitin-binding type-2 domain-containing protein n=1 Tax=Tetragonisca angustula TaxID=166442 RepID=A0AAW0ZN11_9HYME
MNLALHGFLLQVLLSILNLQHGSLLCSAGEPGYLDFDNLPETNFSCQGKVIGGYYADVEAGCQMFHVCTIGQKDEIMDIKFLCLNGTVFDQETRVCERVDEVDCSKSERFYNLNLELYGNNAVTLSLHENSEEDVDQSDSIDDHQRTTSARPTTTTTTSTTTTKPSKPSTTPSSSSFSHPAGYPQHFQPQPPFPQVHTSQSKSLYDDKNGGYHHQYIFHNGERTNNQQATSYQLFSNQGASSTTVQPPQVHQIRFSSTSTPQIIHNEPSTVAPLFHATSSTIQTLLNSNGNSPALINPIFHNHGIASTTEQFIHSNNPRETSDYRETGEQSIRSLETNKGKVSKLTISTVPASESSHSVQTKTSSQSSQSRISGNFLPTPTPDETTVRSFYPTPRTSSKPPQPSQSTSEQVAQTHIHVLPPVQIPQLKPHQITINLPPPDLQRIVQNPSSLLPSQSRVIVTAKASVSDESGRPLNTTQLVTLPLPTIPASYDDYKEGDESFDPFYRDVPKIRNSRRLPDDGTEGSRRVLRFRRSVGPSGRKRETEGFGTSSSRARRSVGQTKSSMVSFVYAGDSKGKRDEQATAESQSFPSIRDSLMRFRDILFGEDFTEDAVRSVFEGSRLQGIGSDAGRNSLRRDSLEDLETKASKNFKARDYEEDGVEESRTKQSRGFEISLRTDTRESDAEEYVGTDGTKDAESDSKDLKDVKERFSDARDESNDEHESDSKRGKPEGALDVVTVDRNEHTNSTSRSEGEVSSSTEMRQVSTEIPTISTTEEIAGIDPVDKQGSENSKHVDDAAKDREQSGSRNDNDEKSREEGRRKPKERKPAARRKSSRVRSPRGKISSRKKEMKVESNEPILDQKVETTAVTASSDSGQIDKRIFDEPESQTSKEIDVRAVNTRDSYAKNFQIGKEHDSGKEARMGEANEYETLQKQSRPLGRDEEESLTLEKIAEDEKETNVPSLDEEKVAEVPTRNLSEEEKTHHREESEVGRDTVEDESTTGFSNEDSQEDEDETIENSRKQEIAKAEDSSKEKVSSREQDRLEETEDEEEEYSTTKSDETSSEEVSTEYREASTEASYESTYEMGADSDYTDSGSSEDATVSSEHLTSEETPSSEERNLEEREEDEGSVLSDQEESTEGILKFTDELPKDKKEDVLEVRRSSESIENIAHDYVDDNYEPDNYKEREPSDSNNLSEEKTNKEMLADGKTEHTKKETEEDELEISTESEKDQTEGTDSPTEESDTEKTDLTETTVEETTTTTTTTVRSTPPKLFKPISARKNYNYIPPTTTPNPVIIKPRLSLLNPKPAKPPKSYNDLAPKPVIRKFTLLARKPTTTVAITTITEEDSTETVEAMTTEALTTTTEASRSEENTLEKKLKPLNESEEKIQAPVNSKDDQDPSPSEQKSPSNVKQNEEEGFTPYPVSTLSTLASAVEKSAKEADFSSAEPAKPTSPQSFTLVDLEIVSTTSSPMGLTTHRPEEPSTATVRSTTEEETSIASSTKVMDQVLEDKVTEDAASSSISEATSTSEAATRPVEAMESTTMRSLSRNLAMLKRQGGFNCLEKEMYRFYGDTRDCRLFHYCSPGFTSRQVLDFRFVCEEGTAFDEESQSCRHDARNNGCLKREW